MRDFGTTIFAEMSALAAETGAVNLGQGFPDTDGPREMLEAAKAAIDGGRNQYPPGPGVPELLDAIAAHQWRFYGIDLDPRSQVLVTVGATEAIAAAVLALCEPGDEVVTFEPYYDSYAATIALAGAVRRTSVLRFPDFAVDETSLRAAFSDRTRLVLLNTPHNPTGKVFTRAELEAHLRAGPSARRLGRHGRGVRAPRLRRSRAHPRHDRPRHGRAHAHGVLGGKDLLRHRLEGRLDHGPAEAVAAVPTVKQFLTYVGSGPFQPAVAVALGLGDDVYAGLAGSLQEAETCWCRVCRRPDSRSPCPRGPTSWWPTRLRSAPSMRSTSAASVPGRAGVVGVPVSVFHDDRHAARTLVRFAFCKRDEVLVDAVGRLTRAGAGMGTPSRH